jgi:DNA-binding response OmpR family regulator
VKAASSDADALKLLEAEAEAEAGKTAVLVTDINLGRGVTGFDIARKARSINPALTVVYITGQAAHLERFGFQDALMFEKPFRAAELANRLASLVEPTLP